MNAEGNSSDEERGVVITYETLFEILRREKGREELQKLHKNFYQDVVKYIQEKNEILKRAQTTLFSPEEREKTEIQLQNIKRIIKELYSRRERKIIETAIIKSRTQSNVIDIGNMLEEERRFFEEVVTVLDSARMNILFNVLEAKMPHMKTSEELERKTETAVQTKREEELKKSMTLQEGVRAEEGIQAEEGIKKHDESQTDTRAGEKILGEKILGEKIAEEKKNKENGSKETKMVRFKCAVPRFYGLNAEICGPFEEDDIACFQKEIADILIRKGRAEEIKEE